MLPGVTYLFTRRCSERRFFLRPSAQVNEIFLYCLGLAAQVHHIQLHAFCAMSNHYHLVLTDPEARLPAFAQLLNAMVARAMNVVLERWDHFWAPRSYSAVRLLGEWEYVEKAAYVLCNPVNAGLVPLGRMWPGAWSAPERVGGAPYEARKPEVFFDPYGLLPEQVEVRLVPPPGYGAEEFRGVLSRLTGSVEREKVARMRQEGQRFAGVRRVLTLDPETSSLSVEERRATAPLFASHDKWKREEMSRQQETFLEEHEEAFRAYQDGDHRLVFPAGTYWMRVILNARCRAPG